MTASAASLAGRADASDNSFDSIRITAARAMLISHGVTMNLSNYRSSQSESLRTDDILRLVPSFGSNALDIGARDGHFSLLLAERFNHVVALDLELPAVTHPKVECIKGNAASLGFSDQSFEFSFCAEVLEHIPSDILTTVCHEISRVTRDRILIGVPYRQDTRIGRTTCQACGTKNPPWGHVNSFDESRLAALFPHCTVEQISFVGETSQQTNAVSVQLLDWAGNPYGTYEQEEPCIACGLRLQKPPARTVTQKALTRLGHWSRRTSEAFASSQPNWMHVLLAKAANPSHQPVR